MSKIYKIKELVKKIIACTTAATIISVPFSAFSLDERYILEKGKEENYWSTIDGEIWGDGDEYSGIVKYIIDEENGCFYLCFNFYDYKLDTNCDDNIALGFTITNKNREYYFSVDKRGFTNKSTEGIDDYINICYSFDDASCSRNGGDIYLGFELKNKADKSVLNHISCQYYCGDIVRRTIFDDLTLDMSSNQSAENTTKNSSSEKATSSNNKEKLNDSESNTKFSSSGTISNNSNSSSDNDSGKFSSGKSNSTGSEFGDDENSEIFSASADNQQVEDTENQSALTYSQERSDSVKIIIAVSTLIIIIGIICVLTGIFYKSKKKENSNQDNSSNESEKDVVKQEI